MKKFAIFGDIHGNLEALQAVLYDAAQKGCTDYACLGDIVGYNANPAECVQIIRELNCPTVQGNHDEEASSLNDLSGMNPTATAALAWTRNQLSEDDKTWLRQLRKVRSVPPFTIVHSSLDQPGFWNYILNKFDALSNFPSQFTQLCFHGHTHVPKFFVFHAGQVEELIQYEIIMEPDKKYFINAGSVGQPRDGIPYASYATFTPSENRITIERVPYDIATTQAKILAAGLPDRLAARLEQGR